ncbi:type II toxin-antitoxin system VapC family toxin [Bradyrhizobium septentrionale]|uniref:PIN domain-containing protein n=1 Tax=Bradyrhizobium septentrionale TaxID=1404411 RepID=A0ABZ2P4T5_9BRAD
MAITKRVYWDACSWIALIQKEKILQPGGAVEDREMMCKSVIEAARKNRLEIATSAFCLAEVCKTPDMRLGSSSDRIAEFFENDFILITALDTVVGHRARKLMTGGYAGLKPPDAVHIATALILNVDEMHTFDDALLALDGRLDKDDGTKLEICKPSAGDPTPLFGSNPFDTGKQ